jgi:DNA-directed RNA polymerase specialized sigma24 family protein
VERTGSLGTAARDARLGRRTRAAEDHFNLNADVAEVIAQLPPELRELAEQLKHLPKAEVARRLGLPTSSMRPDLRKLRRLFEKAGLRSYLQ